MVLQYLRWLDYSCNSLCLGCVPTWGWRLLAEMWWRHTDSLAMLGLGHSLTPQLSPQRLTVFSRQEAIPLPLPSFLLWQQVKQLLSQLWFSGSQMTFSPSSLPVTAPKVDTMGSFMALLCLLPLLPGRSQGGGGGVLGQGCCHPG